MSTSGLYNLMNVDAWHQQQAKELEGRKPHTYDETLAPQVGDDESSYFNSVVAVILLGMFVTSPITCTQTKRSNLLPTRWKVMPRTEKNQAHPFWQVVFHS